MKIIREINVCFNSGQWGAPTVNAAMICGLLAGLLASIVDSVGDYYACARLSDAPPPPSYAINRGITAEGLGCFIAGAIGAANGTTSNSTSIGVVGITKVNQANVCDLGRTIGKNMANKDTSGLIKMRTDIEGTKPRI